MEAARQPWTEEIDDSGQTWMDPAHVSTVVPFPSAEVEAERDSGTVIDCDTCVVRGSGCGDCVVTFLLGGPPSGVELTADERGALDALAGGGLVPPLRMESDGATSGDAGAGDVRGADVIDVTRET